MQILILCSGSSKRFKDQSYSHKALLPIEKNKFYNKTILNKILDECMNLGIKINTIHVSMPIYYDYNVIQSHLLKVSSLIDNDNIILKTNCAIGVLDSYVGSLISTKQYIEKYMNNHQKQQPLLVINCDQLIKTNLDLSLLPELLSKHSDGALFHHKLKRDNNFGYSEVVNNKVVSIREKDNYTDYVHTGHYLFKDANTYLFFANRVIANQEKINNEFYISSVIKEMLSCGKTIDSILVDDFIPLGTPEMYEKYMKSI